MTTHHPLYQEAAEHMTEAGLTIRDIASITGLSVSSLSKWEDGHSPRIDRFIEYLDAGPLLLILFHPTRGDVPIADVRSLMQELQRIRQTQNLTVLTAATKAGLSEDTIRAWEQRTTFPLLDNLDMYATALGCSFFLEPIPTT